jgi:hypothetical protein
MHASPPPQLHLGLPSVAFHPPDLLHEAKDAVFPAHASNTFYAAAPAPQKQLQTPPQALKMQRSATPTAAAIRLHPDAETCAPLAIPQVPEIPARYPDSLAGPVPVVKEEPSDTSEMQLDDQVPIIVPGEGICMSPRAAAAHPVQIKVSRSPEPEHGSAITTRQLLDRRRDSVEDQDMICQPQDVFHRAAARVTETEHVPLCDTVAEHAADQMHNEDLPTGFSGPQGEAVHSSGVQPTGAPILIVL